ncbi:MAG: hypothetical protein MUE44_33825 [Oscillatoriaceae cyanobacterium Prado104]|nr:hypothetical protein [Oscillatoriaceae cyanobacterium Prado104]
MQAQEVLQFIEKAVYAKTGKHLNDLQREIIEGTLKRQKYDDIAENCGCSAGHVKDVGYELLQMLSDVFDEPVNKHNLKSVLERQGNLNISLGDRSVNSNIIGCVNMGSEQPTATHNENQPETSEFQRVKNKTNIEIIDKLRQFGLSDEQIAEALNIPLEQLKQVDSD